MSKDITIRSSVEEFLIFKTQEKDEGIYIKYDKESLWMTQKSMSELFGCSVDNISLHLKKYLKNMNQKKKQLPRNTRQLPQMVKNIE